MVCLMVCYLVALKVVGKVALMDDLLVVWTAAKLVASRAALLVV